MYYISQVAYRGIGSLFFCLFLFSCAGTPQSDSLIASIPATLKKPVELKSVPFYPQQSYQCGPAALATLIDYQGRQLDFEDLIRKVYIPDRKGSLQIELIAASREYDLIPYVLATELDTVLHEVNAGRPVLVLQNLGVSWYPQWHYAVIVGYDLNAEELILRSGETKRYRLNLFTFEYTWQRGRRWSMILLKPGELPVKGDEQQYMQAIVPFEQRKNWKLLDKAFLSGLKRWPRSRELLMGYGNNLYAQGYLAVALEQYQKVIAEHGDYAPAYNNAAQVYAELGLLEKAISYVQKAISLGGVHSQQYRSTLEDIRRMQNKN